MRARTSCSIRVRPCLHGRHGIKVNPGFQGTNANQKHKQCSHMMQATDASKN